MCHHRRYQTLWNLTQRANQGIGICCKLNATEGPCAPNNKEGTCSMKADDKEPTLYKDVLSAGNRNYQMFAFCPTINQNHCGIGDSNQTDFVLKANSSVQTLQTSSLKYMLGDQFTREYDACHYHL